MAMSVDSVRHAGPGLDPARPAQYAAALEMATWADESGFDMLVLSRAPRLATTATCRRRW